MVSSKSAAHVVDTIGKSIEDSVAMSTDPPHETTNDLDDDNDSTSRHLGERRPLLARGISAVSVIGTVRLTDGGLVYIPPATADPRGR